ncbi:MAG TPA: DUF4149 domain-containing protein [Myxococcaceae bacterium]|nr:DUF4149 domain-containing protein [Myxococcaceae bacterium]
MLLYVWRLLLGAWVGALLCFGVVVAPALFSALSPVEAGLVVRQVIPKLDVFGMAAAVVLLGLWVRGARDRKGWIARGLLAAMGSLAALSFLVITPRMEALRAAAGGKISELPAEDARRMEFGRLHGASSAASAAVLVLGIASLALPPRTRERA